MRDIHTIEWICNAITGSSTAAKHNGLLSEGEVITLGKAQQFLQSLRCYLQRVHRRSDDRITFEIQEELAEILGYSSRRDLNAPERLMKHYFLTASDIGHVMRGFLLRVDDEFRPRSKNAALPKKLKTDEIGGGVNLKIVNGRLDFRSRTKAGQSVTDQFRFFRAHSKQPGLALHPDALAVITETTHLIRSDVRKDPQIAALFLNAVSTGKEPVKLLRIMSDTGVLGRYIPTFGKIQGRVEYGLYRRYTFDEHVFQSIGVLRALVRGDLLESHPITSQVLSAMGDKIPVFLAVLLQEAGWVADQQKESTAKLVGRIARRLGLSKEDAALVAATAGNRDLMTVAAERRNLGLPETIRIFASKIESTKMLDSLLVMTVCHLRSVSESAWDDWTRRHIRTLYEGTRAWLEDGDAGLENWYQSRLHYVRNEVFRALNASSSNSSKMFPEQISMEMATTMSVNALMRVSELSGDAESNDAAVSLEHGDGKIEAIVTAKDRAGLLGDLAGVIAGHGGSVKTVHALPFGEDGVIDVITFSPMQHHEDALEGAVLSTLHADLLRIAKKKPTSAPKFRPRIGDRRGLFSVPSEIRLDAKGSEECLIVEAEGRDRPGLLHMLSSALAEMGVMIRSAHISTHGARAVDTFYVQDAPGYKITNKRRQEAIKRRLYSVLEEG